MKAPNISTTKPGTDAACAAIASGISTTVANPFEVAKTRLQLQRGLATQAANGAGPAVETPRYRGSVHALVTIGRSEGLKGLYRGFSGFMFYRIAVNGPRLGLFHPTKEFLIYRTPKAIRELHDGMHTLIASSMTGLVGSFTGNPFNVIKVRCMNFAADSSKDALSGTTLEVARDIVRNEGVLGFWRGMTAGAPRVMAGSASQLTAYEFFKQRILEQSRAVKTDNPIAASLREHNWEVHLLSSVLSGAVSTTCFCPFDTISSRLYMPGSAYQGFWDCAIKTVRGEGWLALERGWLAIYARTGPTSTVTMVLWEAMRNEAGCATFDTFDRKKSTQLTSY